ncbi:MAG: rhodanese-like domain-containing protein [Candidatus Competibacteraceae bacterium]
MSPKLSYLFRHCGGLLLLGACLLSSVRAESPAVIDPAEAYAKVKTGELVLIDVRTPSEWRQSGIPERAIPIDLRQEGGPAAFERAVLDAVKGNRNRPIAVICAGGTRSAHAQQILEQAGFTHVQDVSEGVTGRSSETGWIHRGLPMTPCKDCEQRPQ